MDRVGECGVSKSMLGGERTEEWVEKTGIRDESGGRKYHTDRTRV